MSVLISYSHLDSDFALLLTQQIFRRGEHIWLDKCEIRGGDDFEAAILTGIQKATAIIAVLSKASVESIWCRKEVKEALNRESQEKSLLIIPLLLEDCKIPAFCKSRSIVDFRRDFESGIGELMAAISRYAVLNSGRAITDSNDFIDDYSFETILQESELTLKFHLFQHSYRMPISVFSIIDFKFNEESTYIWALQNKLGFPHLGTLRLLEWACAAAIHEEWLVILKSPDPVSRRWLVTDKGMQCCVSFTCRRLGDDPGAETHVRGQYEFEKILDLMRTRIAT